MKNSPKISPATPHLKVGDSEFSVEQMIIEGKTQKEIVHQLDITPVYLTKYLIMRKSKHDFRRIF